MRRKVAKRYSLAIARVNKGLTQERTAELVGISVRQYQNIESGNCIDPKYSTRIAISNITGVDAGTLEVQR